MESADEESKNNIEDKDDSRFPLINIYNKLTLISKDSSGNYLLKDKKDIYICGKMNSHASDIKYNFQACTFHLYIPSENQLFYSNMNSEDCFTNSLKWNYKLYKNIRECLTNSELNLKRYYFAINNTSTRDNANSSKEKDKDKDDLEIDENKNYLELHFYLKKRDIVVFRLLLEEIIQNDPYSYFINQVIIMDNSCEEELLLKKKKQFKQNNEIKEIENNIRIINDDYEKKTKEMIIKFNLLNKSKIEEEKNLKIKLKKNGK
jgi:hypothetical protein